MLIGFSIYKRVNRKDESEEPYSMIDIIKRNKTKCAEIVFAWNHEMEHEFKKSHVKWLKGLEFLSVHAPYREDVSEKGVERIKDFQKNLGAKRVVVHPGQDLKKFKGHGIKISIENLNKRRGTDFSFMNSILKKNRDLGFCLDITHASSFSQKEMKKYLDKYKNRITHIHLSGYSKAKEHVHLSRCSSEFLDSIKQIKEMEVPMILEISWKSKKPKELIHEINFVRDFLKK